MTQTTSINRRLGLFMLVACLCTHGLLSENKNKIKINSLVSLQKEKKKKHIFDSRASFVALECYGR